MSMERYVELYRFVRGGDRFHYSSGDIEVEHEGFTYEPLAIARDGIELGPEIVRSSVRISVPLESEIGEIARTRLSEDRVDVTILRRIDPGTEAEQTLVIWQGHVADRRHAPLTAELICKPLGSELRKTGLRQRFGRMCRWRLYSTGCGVDRDDHAVTSEIDAIDGRDISVPAAALVDDGWYVGGYVEHTTGYRYVRRHEGTLLELVSAVPEWSAGDSVILRPGCNHTLSDCHEKFNNVENFGGYPWIPDHNPHDGRQLT